ncbi:MarR family transcriptional regulator [Catellatospora sp. TT07R-123]|uniref:MarR family transcriptional regulator n=1 Tax=Catellatospora sp. TT07R-123 TaxID=2733863 RepID=UPI001B010F7C|nr:MarR family transcriptional regulator [Catellatospora sp. TT07R-123]GHJ47890.1 MarR family transcriptional regulator [Catellatospora sp. TT07R-123]
MTSVTAGDSRDRRRLTAGIKQTLRDLRNQLSILNRQVSGRLELRDIDLDCLDVISRHGPMSPSALARQVGLHPATLTGILDRLERAGWIARDRHPTDRRAVTLRAVTARGTEIFGLYAGMNASLDEICAGYDEAQLRTIADFLDRANAAGRDATEELSEADQ